MLSQFGKTIKKALKSTQKERQLLRARSAVQRFPVIEWRQCTEDFHKKSINASRKIAGQNAWRKTDGDTSGMIPIQHVGDWDPVRQDGPSRPAWDQESVMNSPTHTARLSVKTTSHLQTETRSLRICLEIRLLTATQSLLNSSTTPWKGPTGSSPIKIKALRTHSWSSRHEAR